MKEEKLAGHVVKWLQIQGWDVYQEVQLNAYAPIADIVAVKNKSFDDRKIPLVWIIEAKQTLGFRVLNQGLYWLMYANFVSTATPPKLRQKNINVVNKIYQYFGIGKLDVGYGGNIYEDIQPRFFRRVTDGTLDILNHLSEYHKTFAPAGNAENLRFTAFQWTKLQLIEFVKANKGITLKEAVESITHHYSSNISARCALSKWIRDGSIPGLKVKKVEGKLCVFVKSNEKTLV